MDGCIYRTKDGECDLYAEGGKYHAFCVGDVPCDGRKQSNADKIRQMSDDGLAKWIVGYVLGLKGGMFETSVNSWLDWLKQEANDV